MPSAVAEDGPAEVSHGRPSPGRPTAVLLALCLSVLTFLLLAGHDRWSGRTLISVTPTHGLDVGDLPVLAVWVVGMVLCARLWHVR